MSWITKTDLGELDPDDLKQIAGVIWSNRKAFGWIGVGLQVDDGENMVEGVEDGRI